jgi:hypothetical protein
MSLIGKQIRYVVPHTRKPYWEGIVTSDLDCVVWVTVTTPGYEGDVEWVAYDQIIAVRSEQGEWRGAPFSTRPIP